MDFCQAELKYHLPFQLFLPSCPAFALVTAVNSSQQQQEEPRMR